MVEMSHIRFLFLTLKLGSVGASLKEVQEKQQHKTSELSFLSLLEFVVALYFL